MRIFKTKYRALSRTLLSLIFLLTISFTSLAVTQQVCQNDIVTYNKPGGDVEWRIGSTTYITGVVNNSNYQVTAFSMNEITVKWKAGSGTYEVYATNIDEGVSVGTTTWTVKINTPPSGIMTGDGTPGHSYTIPYNSKTTLTLSPSVGEFTKIHDNVGNIDYPLTGSPSTWRTPTALTYGTIFVGTIEQCGVSITRGVTVAVDDPAPLPVPGTLSIPPHSHCTGIPENITITIGPSGIASHFEGIDFRPAGSSLWSEICSSANNSAGDCPNVSLDGPGTLRGRYTGSRYTNEVAITFNSPDPVVAGTVVSDKGNNVCPDDPFTLTLTGSDGVVSGWYVKDPGPEGGWNPIPPANFPIINFPSSDGSGGTEYKADVSFPGHPCNNNMEAFLTLYTTITLAPQLILNGGVYTNPGNSTFRRGDLISFGYSNNAQPSVDHIEVNGTNIGNVSSYRLCNAGNYTFKVFIGQSCSSDLMQLSSVTTTASVEDLEGTFNVVEVGPYKTNETINFTREGGVGTFLRFEIWNGAAWVTHANSFTPTVGGTYTFRAASIAHTECGELYTASVDVVILDPTVVISEPAPNELFDQGSSQLQVVSTETDIPPGELVSYYFEVEGQQSNLAIDKDDWSIPIGQAIGTTYRIRANTCGRNFYSSNFRIREVNPRALLLPKDGRILENNKSNEIRWAEIPNYTFHVYHTNLSTQEKVQIDDISNPYSTANSISSFLWSIPGDVLGNYEFMAEEENDLIRVVSTVEVVNELNIVSPNEATTYGLGEKMNITWTGGSVARPVEVKIVGYDVSLQEVFSLSISDALNTDRLKEWPVAETLDESLMYKIMVRHEIQAPGETVAYLTDYSDDFFLVQHCPNAPKVANLGYNYVKEFTSRVALSGCISAQDDADKVQENIVFFDGLGRPTQEIARQFTPDKKDFVSNVGYDVYGRKVKDFLPYKTTGNEGIYVPDWGPDQNTFYDQFGVDEGNYAFSETILESSPLSRPLAQAAPGKVWSKDFDPVQANLHLVDYIYGVNDVDDVRNLEFTDGTIVDNGLFLSGKVFKNETTDENTGSKEGHVIEFSNTLGQTLAKKVKISDGGDETEVGDIYATTYYIYDDFGNLIFVVQPEGVRLIEDANEPTNTWASLNDEGFQANWMFSYQYDGRRRLIAKRVPGSGWTRFVYDKRDRLVLTQDPNRRKFETLKDGTEIDEYVGKDYYIKNGSAKLTDGFTFNASATGTFTFTTKRGLPQEWTYTKYDHLNRPVLTGQVTLNGDREDLQGDLDSWTGPMNENLIGLHSTAMGGYDNASFPTQATDADLLTATYYDNYAFISSPITGYYNKVKGLATGSITKVLGASTELLTVNYYDNKLRLVKTTSNTHLGSDEVELTYLNSVSPLVTSSERTHQGPAGQGSFKIKESYSFDHMDRPLVTLQELGNPNNSTLHAPVTIASNTYNDLGQLLEKNIGNAIQSIDYDYNIRGWLNSINNYPTVGGGEGDKFWLWLRYYNIYAPSGWDQFNGNIGAVSWRNAGTSSADRQWQILDYDNASRMTKSLYGNSTNTTFTGHFNSDGIQYDLNGNIQVLNRYKSLDGAKILIDGLSYDSYVGNQLQSVTDNGDPAAYSDPTDDLITKKNDYGFLDGNIGSTDYFYDANGNMTADLNKGISQINYNYLNLPEQVTFASGDLVKYTYDAAGMKLKKEATIGASVTTTDYVGGMHYVNGALSFIQHAEGRALYQNPGFAYEYNLTDHLGNVRVTVDETGNVVQADDYYPFGLTFNSTVGSPANNYLYNQGTSKTYQGAEGKSFKVERQAEWGVDLTKFRAYDPALGRFLNVDPLADQAGQESWTPYHYSFNNPVRWNDPYGDCVGCDPSLVVGLVTKYAVIASQAIAPAQRLISGTSGSVPSSRNISDRTRTTLKIAGNANDANKIADTGKQLAKEGAKDLANAADKGGEALSDAGVIAAPFTGGASMSLVLPGEVISAAGKTAKIGINLSEGNLDAVAGEVINLGVGVATSGLTDAAVKQSRKVGNITNKSEDVAQESILSGISSLFNKVTSYFTGETLDDKNEN